MHISEHGPKTQRQTRKDARKNLDVGARSPSPPVKRHVSLRLGEFTIYALAGEKGPASGQVRSNAVRALRYYLGEHDTGRPDWPCPTFLSDGGGGSVELDLAVDDDLWRSFEREAERQGVDVGKLADHAALYFAADRDAGRLTDDALDQLDD